jgi:hypothetical protein
LSKPYLLRVGADHDKMPSSLVIVGRQTKLGLFTGATHALHWPRLLNEKLSPELINLRAAKDALCH